MAKDILEKIKWEYFLKHPIVKAFIENHDEDEFIKDLEVYAKGDYNFQDIIQAKSLSSRDILKIVRHIESVMSRRGFLKSAVAVAVSTAIGGSPKQQTSGSNEAIKSDSRLKVKGICYDIGTRYAPNFITRQEINSAIMKRELNIIKNKLNCNAVRIYGEDIRKLVECSKIALSYGLQVWFSPRLINGSEYGTLDYVKNCAAEAEKLRRVNRNVIFIIGNELTLDMEGLVPGNTYQERGSNLFSNVVINKIKNIFSDDTPNKRLNKFLRKIVNEVRLYFKGHITYAAGFWEDIGWDMFDIVGINHYLNMLNKITYRKNLRELQKFKKPIAVLEFGCGSYKGAEDKGGSSYDIVDWNKQKPEIKGNRIKDENVQADYILNLLSIFVQESVYAAFVYTFIETHYPADDLNPKYDLDMASFNVIKVYTQGHPKSYLEGHIIPKKSFFDIAEFYKNH